MKKFDVIIVDFDPSKGNEIEKKRPAVVISDSNYNKFSNMLIVAPITSTIKDWGTRISINEKNVNGQIALDQLRSISSTRIEKKIDSIKNQETKDQIDITLTILFGI